MPDLDRFESLSAFVLQKPQNLDLALQVHQAMPQIVQDLIRKVVERAVAELQKERPQWVLDRNEFAMQWGKRAGLRYTVPRWPPGTCLAFTVEETGAYFGVVHTGGRLIDDEIRDWHGKMRETYREAVDQPAAWWWLKIPWPSSVIPELSENWLSSSRALWQLHAEFESVAADIARQLEQLENVAVLPS